jgi:transposase
MLRAKGRGSGEWIDMKPKDLDALLERTRGKVSEEDFRLLKALADSLIYFTDVIENDRMTIRELRRLILGKGSERTRKVLLRAGIEGKDRESDKTEPPGGEKKKRPGHGRNGAEAYRGANRVEVSHPTLASGDGCPGCLKGKVYPQRPAFLVRVVGRSPIHADVYALAKFRCNLCGEVFTAPAPEGVGEEKYDASAAAMIGLLKYGTGLPFNRLEGLQESLGIPLPASTQWEIVEEASRGLEPVFEELVGQAAQGEILHNDDTSMKVLTLMKENEERAAKGSAKESDRTGIFTSGIVSMAEGRRIALFFTGRQHAGENLKDVLAQRNRELKTPIQMCDALSRNLPRELEVVLANCLAHGRRRFVGVVESFPEECRHVLETLRKVYENDATAKVRPGRGHRLHAEALGEADAVSTGARSATRQQCRREGLEEGDSPSEEQPLLQNADRGARGRPVHEPHPHLRALEGRPLRLSHRALEELRGGVPTSRRLDAVDLPGDPGPHRRLKGCQDPGLVQACRKDTVLLGGFKPRNVLRG